MYADKELIEWVLFESGKTAPEIVSNTTLTETPVRGLMAKKASVDHMRFHNAVSLTEYAKELKGLEYTRENTDEKLLWLVEQYASIGENKTPEELVKELISAQYELIKQFGITNVMRKKD